MASHQRFDEEELSRRVTRCSAFSLAIAAASLSAVYGSQSNPTLQGWVAAAGAALVFGGSSLPAKHPAAVAAGTLDFQLWVTVGNTGLNLLLLLLLHVPIRWDWWGVAGAAILTSTQLLAWPAIQALGAAAGPGVWCGIGMCTAFVWGVVVFGERLRSVCLAAAALLALVSGVAGVAASQFIATRRAAAPAPALLERGAAAWPAARPRALAAGLACAVGTGLLDGSLMAPFSAFERQQQQQQQQQHPRPHDDAVALRYLGGFTLGLLCVALPPLLLSFVTSRLLGTRSSHAASHHLATRCFPVECPPGSSSLSLGDDDAHDDDDDEQGHGSRRATRLSAPCAGAGIAAGALWAAGNVLSVHATMRLGQAVGFPLTQVCVVVSALWGILYFDELRDRTSKRVFAASAVLVLAGAAALKLAGAAVAPVRGS